ncbi:hypothetical protein [Olivibacter domesticus]|uniref:Uncharacterized protein n=1 Tax=Olivibacter domesticus TaxID=407022 RepID=A0A1H7ICL9_OLID1|nr:hypothetical protein [Olivibacter domesticus]SEK60246.1 hypothetical protein SAMN05661044_00657 [Olivibacter domesticus]
MNNLIQVLYDADKTALFVLMGLTIHLLVDINRFQRWWRCYRHFEEDDLLAIRMLEFFGKTAGDICIALVIANLWLSQ